MSWLYDGACFALKKFVTDLGYFSKFAALSHGYIYNLTEMNPCDPDVTSSNGTINGTANGTANQRSAKIEILGTPTGNLIHEHRIADDTFHRVVNM